MKASTSFISKRPRCAWIVRWLNDWEKEGRLFVISPKRTDRWIMDFLCTIYWNSSDHYFFDRLSALNSRHKEDARLDKQGPRVIYAEKIGAWYVKDLAVKIDQKSGVQELSWTEPAGMRISSSETLEAQTLGKPIRRQMTMHPFE